MQRWPQATVSALCMPTGHTARRRTSITSRKTRDKIRHQLQSEHEACERRFSLQRRGDQTLVQHAVFGMGREKRLRTPLEIGMRIQRRETSLRRVDTCVHDERGCPQAADEDRDIQPVQGTKSEPAERMPGIILMPASVLTAIIAAS